MTRPECPLPQVEDALTPYINTREKTTRIRQILTKHTRRQVKDENEPTHLSLSIPPSSLKVTGTTVSSQSLYQQYLKALQAHQQARERYDTVKEELDQLLRRGSEDKIDRPVTSSSDSVREYADLLRRRRHLRKLEILQDALSKLLDNDPNPASVDIKTAVREDIGEPPQAPIASTFNGDSAAGGDAGSTVQDLTFKLKKELLVAKNKLADAKSAKEDAANQSANGASVDPEEVVGLIRDARDELISWVEGELAKIPEDEVEASQAEISFLGGDDEESEQHGRPMSNDELSARVEQLYEKYLDSRRTYISEVEAALERSTKLQDSDNAKAGATLQSPRRPTMSSTSAQTSSITAATLLPALSHLNATTHTNALLQSQTAHLRRQLNLASSETQILIQRLAGESLLVPQDSTSVAAWSKAAQDANQKTKDLVMGNVIEGEASVALAKKVLEGLRARRRGLESLRRDL